MRKYPRIEIDQKAYDGLQIEAVLRGMTVRDLATKAILCHISKEAIMVLDHKTYGEDVMATEPTSPPAPYHPAPQDSRPKQLARDKPAVEHIHRLWTSTAMNFADIARQVDRPRQTVEALIKRHIAQGILPPRPERSQENNPEA
jgi:hypothetical protein